MGNLTKSQHTGAKQWDENRQQGRGIFAAPPSTLAIADRPSSATAASDKMQMIRDEQRAAEKPVYGCMTREEWLPGWLGVDVLAALVSWNELWGDAPQTSRSREAALYWREQQAHALIARIEGKRLANTLVKNPVKNQPDSVIPSRNQPVSADKKPAEEPSPRLQFLIDMTIPDENRERYFKDQEAKAADKKPAILPQSLQSAADVVPGKHEAETEAEIAKAHQANGTERVDELIDDVNHALKTPDAWNKYGVALLFDDRWLRKGRSGIVYLEGPSGVKGLAVGVPTAGETTETFKRSELLDWMRQDHEGRRRPAEKNPPFAQSHSGKTGQSRSGVPAPAGLATANSSR